MKILVTGGAGFIASHVVDAYVELGHQVVIVDDMSSGRESNLNRAAKLYQVDIRTPQLAEVFAAERPDCVNHHAAQISVRHSVERPLDDALLNIGGSLNLIETARQFGIKKIIYASSGGAVYGEPEYLPCDEKHPVNPLCPYGASKHAPEHYLFMYDKLYGLNYTVLRYSNVYGPRQDPLGEAGVIAIFTGQMLEGQQAIINGTGEQERDYVYVGDVARASVLALEKGDRDTFNIGFGIGTTVNQVFAKLKEATGYQRSPMYGAAKAGETFRIFLDNRKARRELGWEPAIDLDEGMRRTVEFFRAKKTDGVSN
jgi:UDP-glucose 4-epimerase